jgi:hypothetical protein
LPRTFEPQWRPFVNDADFAEIRELVKDYYEGMVYGRSEALARVFETGARFQGVRDDDQVRRGLPEFLTMIASAGDEPLPASEYSVSVELIDVMGTVGVVKVKDRFRGRMYVDYLTLVRTAAGWRIVNKAFTTID